MYVPKLFEESRPEVLQALIRDHALATLVVAGDGGLVANHVPLWLRPGGGTRGSLVGHVARANPLWQLAAGGVDCLAVFSGRNHYISPNGYATRTATGRVVPTWNYEVVHVHGRLEAIDDRAWLHALLTEVTAMHEAGEATPWTPAEPPADYLDGMMKAIVGIRIGITSIVGKFKLSQNQPEANRASLVAALTAKGDADSAAMAGQIVAHRPPG
jgi:transcriptional regulator